VSARFSNNNGLLDDVSAGSAVLQEQLAGFSPRLGIVLGSGFSGLVEELDVLASVLYRDLPGFTPAGVQGHAGVVHAGHLYDRPVLVFEGRYHVYEGYSAWQVGALVRLAAVTGCRRLLLTNAAGGICSRMSPGDFMLVEDHLNLTGQNPLIGRKDAGFPDLHELYRSDFCQALQDRLAPRSIQLHSGVLAWLTGPSYETPAEIRMLETVGAAAVSMSTVPEAIMARFLGLEVCAISFIANLAAGKCRQSLAHKDVLVEAARALDSAVQVLRGLLSLWD